ncbi:hypothetical protein C0J52_22151 [Blattella germanica]|nr:hypothetical protein C0J52_22151 [Blattella germanica]
MDPLPKVLLHEIQCLTCVQYMTPPIKMCFNGHNICKDCRHNIEKCPVCRGNLADIRNLTAESMSRLITHPGVNKKFGCTGHFLLDFKEEHEKKCLFRPIDCPFCQKEGSRLEIQEHFKNDHLVFQEKAEDGKYKTSFKHNSHDPEVKKYKAVHEFGEVFFAAMVKNVCNLEYIGHFYLGEEDEARKFGNKITLTSQDGKETMSSYRLCRSYLSLNKVLGTGHFLLDFKEEHEIKCLFRPIRCAVCKKEGPCLEIQEHIKNDHLNFLEKAKDGKYNRSSKNPKHYSAVHEFGQVFFAMTLKNFCNLDYIGFFYLGEEDEARKFGYKMTLKSQDGNETMSSYRLCRSHLSLNEEFGTSPDNNNGDKYFSTFPKCFKFKAAVLKKINKMSPVQSPVEACNISKSYQIEFKSKPAITTIIEEKCECLDITVYVFCHFSTILHFPNSSVGLENLISFGIAIEHIMAT